MNNERTIYGVLTFLIGNDRVLVAERKDNKVPGGILSAPGGKRESLDAFPSSSFHLELPRLCAQRECREEIDVAIALRDLIYVARVKLYWGGHNDDAAIYDLDIFVSCKWSGEPRETHALRPFWVPRRKVPYHLAREGDRFWWPFVFFAPGFDANVHFANDKVTYLGSHIREWDPARLYESQRQLFMNWA
jgi:8-oxo-dGTP pyrophosphatase MutT (NUDIX family)